MGKLKIAVVTINQPSLTSACNLMPHLHDYDVDIFGKKDLEHNLEHLNLYGKIDEIMPSAWADGDSITAI